MWWYFVASLAETINVAAIFWNERKDIVKMTFPGSAANPTVDENPCETRIRSAPFFSIPDYITALAGVRRAEHGGVKTRFAAEYPDPRFDVLIVSCLPLLARESARWESGSEGDGPSRDDINIRDV